jgi:hypothetical protein
MFHKGVDEGEKQSCYVFTEQEFDSRFSDKDLEGIPRFA